MAGLHIGQQEKVVEEVAAMVRGEAIQHFKNYVTTEYSFFFPEYSGNPDRGCHRDEP